MERVHHATHNALDEATERASEALRSCWREAEVFAGGTLRGAINSGYSRLQHDPVGVIADAGKSVLGGMAVACAFEAAPVITIGAGTVLGAGCAWDMVDPSKHHDRNKLIGNAWNSTWNSHDAHKMNYYSQKIAKAAGPDAFNFAVTSTFGAGGFGFVQKKFAAVAERVVDAGLHRLPTRNLPTIDEAMNQIGLHRTGLNRHASEAMQNWLNGDSHALRRGGLGLKPERSLRIENSTRRPLQTEHSALSHHTTVVEKTQ